MKKLVKIAQNVNLEGAKSPYKIGRVRKVRVNLNGAKSPCKTEGSEKSGAKSTVRTKKGAKSRGARNLQFVVFLALIDQTFIQNMILNDFSKNFAGSSPAPAGDF